MVRPDNSSVASTFPVLDSLRAIAAIAVLGTHAAFWAGDYSEPVWGWALARLDVGVAIFFVLSGFLLSLDWFERHRDGLPAPPVGRYLWKRSLRLVPVYLLTVIAAFTLLPGGDDAGWRDWVSSLLLADIYVDDELPDGLTQMWSLSTEVAFYLALPALMWLILPRRGRGADGYHRLGLVVLAMVVTTVVWLLDLSARLDNGDTMIRQWLPSYLTWFAVGLILAWTVSCLRRPGRAGPDRFAALVQELGQSPGLCWLSAAALFAVAATPVAGPTDLAPPTLGAALTKNLLYAAIAGLVVLPGVFGPTDGRFTRVLSHPLPRHLGHLSYGLFCVHLILLELITGWRDMPLFAGRGVELFFLTLLASLVVSEVLYRTVERPAQRLRNLRPPWVAPAASQAPSAPATSSWGATSAPAQPSSEPSGRSQ